MSTLFRLQIWQLCPQMPAYTSAHDNFTHEKPQAQHFNIPVK